MSTYNEKVVIKLNHLLRKMLYAEKGFEKAANYLKNKQLRDFLFKISEQRSEFAKELKNEIKSFGEEIEHVGNLTGSLHLMWIDIIAIVSPNTKKAMLNVTAKEQYMTLMAYKNILADTSLPLEAKKVLMTQKVQLEKDLSKIKELQAKR